jgi:hypothetical protein
MRWTGRRHLFVPDGSIPWMASHAALPFASPLGGDLFRVYFSPRDARNRAHVASLDLELGREPRVVSVSPEPVLEPGELGAFDDAGANVSCVVRHAGTWFLYYSGWSLGVSVPFYFFIGLATSEDGVHFRRHSRAPVIDRSAVDPFLVGTCSMLVENDVWRMWYVSGAGWKLVEGKPRHDYHVRYAESADGIHWKREGRVCVDFASEAEYAFARPVVIKDDRYRMWFCVRGDRYRMGYAESRDGLAWERRDEQAGIEPSGAGWDSDEIAYPFVFRHAGQLHLLYNGNGYGRTGFGYARAAASSDVP